MSTPNCPSGYSFVESKCLSNCAAGTVVVPSNLQICVSSISCPSGTIPDGTGLACVKVAPIGVQTATGGSCSTGYTRWSSNTCYINCSAGFYENGTECAKIVYPRLVEDATCSGLFTTLRDNKCIVNGWQILTVLAIISFFAILITLIVVAATKTKMPQMIRPYFYPRQFAAK